MVGIRPAKTCRDLDKTPWTRYSKRKPSKSYISSMPHTTLLNYHMGKRDNPEYGMQFDLVARHPVQLRDNAIEAARQLGNKYLEREISGQYYFFVRVSCHNVIRENKMISGAGADRLQKGMRAAFGRPTDRAARIKKGQILLTIRSKSSNTSHIKEALRRIKSKLSGKWAIDEKPIAKA